DDAVARIVKRLRVDGKAVPLRTQLHEQIVQDGVRSDPRLAAWHVGVALRLIPADVRAHRPKNGGDVSAAKRIVECLQYTYVVHALSSDFELRPRNHNVRRLRCHGLAKGLSTGYSVC